MGWADVCDGTFLVRLVRWRGGGLVAAEAPFQLPESRERHEGKRLRRD
eukprot:COSAG01_NODE_41651_length_448_cov_20.223496_1_plen_47_part_01